jgi:hypothetical protein
LVNIQESLGNDRGIGKHSRDGRRIARVFATIARLVTHAELLLEVKKPVNTQESLADDPESWQTFKRLVTQAESLLQVKKTPCALCN